MEVPSSSTDKEIHNDLSKIKQQDLFLSFIHETDYSLFMLFPQFLFFLCVLPFQSVFERWAYKLWE